MKNLNLVELAQAALDSGSKSLCLDAYVDLSRQGFLHGEDREIMEKIRVFLVGDEWDES